MNRPLTVSAPLDSVVRHRFSNHPDAHGVDVATPTLLYAAWALVTSRQVNLDQFLFGIAASPPQPLQPVAVADNDELADGAVSVVPPHVNTTTTQTVAEYLDTLRQLSSERAQQAPCHEDLDTQQPAAFQTLLCIRPLKHSPALSSPRGQEQNREDDAWVNKLRRRRFSLIIELHVGTEETTAAARFPSNVFARWMVLALLQRLSFVALQLATVDPKQHRLA